MEALVQTSVVGVKETIVVGQAPTREKKAFVRLSRPQERAPLLPETLLVMSNVPTALVMLSRESLLQTWLYVRFTVITRSGEEGVDVLDFGRDYVPLDWLPLGLVAEVRHVPLCSQPLPAQLVWPPWQMPPRKGWLFPRDISF